MAKRLGSVRRRPLVVLIAVLIVAALAYFVLGRYTTAEPQLVASRPVAVIGSGPEAVAVAADGSVLAWFQVPEEGNLPQLPLESAPRSGRLAGPALEQVKVLAVTPPALLPYVESSHFGDSGVDVDLTSGIELRFGDAAQAGRKWRAAAVVLANPSITTLDYVDLHAPGHPAIGGSGHTLPLLP